MPDERDTKPLEHVPERVGSFLAVGGDGATIGTDDRQGERRAAARAWVVLDEGDTDGRLADQP